VRASCSLTRRPPPGFCFDEQRLRANETVEMVQKKNSPQQTHTLSLSHSFSLQPVLFYIDPDIVTDRSTRDVGDIVLSYTFFLVDAESGEPEAQFKMTAK
jgi:cytochrome c oxidase assembly protein Cox11